MIFFGPHHYRVNRSRASRSGVEFYPLPPTTNDARPTDIWCGAFESAGRSSDRSLVSSSCVLLSRNESIRSCNQTDGRLRESSGEVLIPYPHFTMFASAFQKATKGYVEVEFRRGITAGEYAFAKIKFGSLKKKHLNDVLSALHEMTQGVPQIPTQTNKAVPVGHRKIPAQVGYVSE
jgi:hypothetical protein